MQRVAGWNVGQEDKETVSSPANFCHHLDEDLGKFEINDREMSLALVDTERGEPFKDRGPGIGIGVTVEGNGFRMVEGDMGGEGVDKLVLSHDRVGEGTYRRSLDAINSSGLLFFSFLCLIAFLALQRQTEDERDGGEK